MQAVSPHSNPLPKKEREKKTHTQSGKVLTQFLLWLGSGLLIASVLSSMPALQISIPLPVGEGKGEGLLIGVALAAEGDVVFKREGGQGGIAPTVFPHWVHRIRYKCYACHPDVFEMKAGANKVSMDAIQEGKFCGACHNGKIAWSVTFETCNRCHVGQ